jgi:putative DNA primase/helicase
MNESNITNLAEKRNKKFLTTKKGKKLVLIHNTQIILDMMDIEVYYDVIKKRHILKSEDTSFNGYITDYAVTKILDFATTQNYHISRSTLTDHILAIGRDNSINKVQLFFERARTKWDGVSRIEAVFNTLPCKTLRWYALAAFKKWCIQAVRLAGNSDGKMKQEYVLVIKGDQGSGKTTWFINLIPIDPEYFKEGLDLNPDNKDNVIECTSHFLVELGELDATMKHEQAKLKAFITNGWDEVRRPYERLSERTPRQTILCATVNEDEFLKDKTGNRRYAVLKLRDGERIDRDKLKQIDLEQFWGEIATLAYQGDPHHFNEEEKAQQILENSNFEMMNETEVRIETGFDWGADINQWRKVSTASICETLGLNSKSKNVAQTLKRNGCEYHEKERPRAWTVPPFTQDIAKRKISHY